MAVLGRSHLGPPPDQILDPPLLCKPHLLLNAMEFLNWWNIRLFSHKYITFRLE